ncbi:glycosyltransferase [Spirochaetota bacterium]
MGLKLNLIIPCFNEEKRLDIKRISLFIKNHKDIDVCFVNDGSKDKTVSILNEFKKRMPKRVQVIDKMKNEGKAEAIRSGALHLSKQKKYSIIGYTDADLAVPLEDMADMKAVFDKKKNLLFLMGSRVRLMGYEIHRKFWRHYIGRIFATCASILLGVAIYDTQCGAKIFKSQLVHALFDKKLRTSWIFDVEILERLMYWLTERKKIKRNNIENYINEMPLKHWEEVGGSKVKPKHYFYSFFDFLVLLYVKIFKAY